MKTKQIGRSGIYASEISIGTFAMSGGTAWSDTTTDAAGAVRLIHEAFDLGVNFFDTAPVYGTGYGEEILGAAIKDRRERVVVGTKCSLNWRAKEGVREYFRDGHEVYRCFTPESIRGDLEDSLRRLGTDYIDVYITHRQPAVADVPELMDTLLALKAEGKIRAIGVSNTTPAHLSAYLSRGQVDLAQERVSLFSREKTDAGYTALCEENGITLQAFRALEEGVLTGKAKPDFSPPAGDVRAGVKWYRPEYFKKLDAMLASFAPIREKYGISQAVLSCAYVRGLSECVTLLVGSRRTETLRDTLRVTDVTLTPQEMEFMLSAALEAERE